MSFYFEDSDLRNSTLEIGFPSCAIEKGNYLDSHGKQIRTVNKESSQAKIRKQRANLCCRCSHRPSCQRFLFALIDFSLVVLF